MVEAGQISIGGDINTQGIERGLTRVEKGMGNVATTGKSVNADFVRMNQATSKLGRSLSFLALVGPTALIGIAKSAPATASAMARIDLAAMKLKFAVGQALKPAFDWFADKLSGIASWVQEHPNLFGVITGSVLALSAALLAFKIGTGIVALFTFLSSPTVLIVLGVLTTLGIAIYQVYKWWKALNEVRTEGSLIEKVIFATGFGGGTGPLSGGGIGIKGIDKYIIDIIASLFRKQSRRRESYTINDVIHL